MSTYDVKAANNKSPKVFCTFSQVNDGFTRTDIVKFAIKHLNVIEGGIVARELHADTGTHFHLAAFGTFTRKNFFPKFEKAVHSYTNSDGLSWKDIGCRAQFAHTNNAPWPFNGAPKPDMIDYLTVTTPKKPVVDMAPRCFKVIRENDEVTYKWIEVDELRDAYTEFHKPTTGVAANVELVVAMAQAGASKADAILAIANTIDRDSAYSYQMLMDLFKATPRFIPQHEYPNFKPYPWQSLVIDRMMLPLDILDNNKRAIWLKTPPGSGKSTLIDLLAHAAGGDDKIFIPATKGGVYCTESLTGYENQKIIIIDDIRAHTDDNAQTHHKSSIIGFTKAIATSDRMAYVLYGQRHEFRPLARILITSNFDMPAPACNEDRLAYERRYICIDTTDVNTISGLFNLPRNLGTANGELVAVAAPATAAAPIDLTEQVQAMVNQNQHPSTPQATQDTQIDLTQTSPDDSPSNEYMPDMRNNNRRPYSPPDSANPAPRNRVRWSDAADGYTFGDEVDGLELEMEALKPPTPRRAVAALNFEDAIDEHDIEFPYSP